MEKNLDEIKEVLLNWYYKNKRNLPWRDEVSAYRTWVSEIMLQQTRVEAVKGYFERFMKSLPTIYDLAQISESELLKLWDGLGYYNRVRNMQKTAQIVVENYDGILPSSYDALLLLPGIGEYTAGAIASIAYGQKVSAVDGNVLRVLMRYLGSYEDISLQRTKQNLKQKLDLVMDDRAGDFNQALMELGAVICIPNGEPLCSICPLKKKCLTYLNDLANVLPVKPQKKKRRVEKKTVLFLHTNTSFAVRKREDKGLLAGLYELPNIDGHLTEMEVLLYLQSLHVVPLEIKDFGCDRHIFSHVEWDMIGYDVLIRDSVFSMIDKETWHERCAIPSAFGEFMEKIEKVLL